MANIGNPNIGILGQATQFSSLANPAHGKPKGSRNLATIVRNIGESDIDWKLLPETAQKLRKKYKNSKAFEAVAYVAMGQAMAGDAQAREWLRRSGYGEKMDVTSNEETIGVTGVDDAVTSLLTGFTNFLEQNTRQVVETTTVNDVDTTTETLPGV